MTRGVGGGIGAGPGRNPMPNAFTHRRPLRSGCQRRTDRQWGGQRHHGVPLEWGVDQRLHEHPLADETPQAADQAPSAAIPNRIVVARASGAKTAEAVRSRSPVAASTGRLPGTRGV